MFRGWCLPTRRAERHRMTVAGNRCRGARRHRARNGATTRRLHTCHSGRSNRSRVLQDALNCCVKGCALGRTRHGARNRTTALRLAHRRGGDIVGISRDVGRSRGEERTVQVRKASGVGMHGGSDCSPRARPTVQFCLAGREFDAGCMCPVPFSTLPLTASNSGS